MRRTFDSISLASLRLPGYSITYSAAYQEGGCSPTTTPLLLYKGVHHAVSQGRDDHEQAAIRPLVARRDDMLYAGPTPFRRLSM